MDREEEREIKRRKRAMMGGREGHGGNTPAVMSKHTQESHAICNCSVTHKQCTVDHGRPYVPKPSLSNTKGELLSSRSSCENI